MFCFDAVARSRTEFVGLLKQTIQVLLPDGALILGILRNTQAYKVGELSFQTLTINEIMLKELLQEGGFSNITIESINAAGKDGSDGLMLALAKL